MRQVISSLNMCDQDFQYILQDQMEDLRDKVKKTLFI